MDIDVFLALLTFAFVTSVTPGPNNMMLLASGVNFGFRRTIPHLFGISLGHAAMVLLVGLGLEGLFRAVPVLETWLKFLSVIYMLWLAAKIARAGEPSEKSSSRPMTFFEAAAFQWVNPKAWAMALGAISAYATDGGLAQIAIVTLVFCLVNLPSVTLWAGMGEVMRGYLADPRRLRIFNWTMAVLLVLSLIPILWA